MNDDVDMHDTDMRDNEMRDRNETNEDTVMNEEEHSRTRTGAGE